MLNSGLFSAFRCITILPMPGQDDDTCSPTKSLVWFPVVGLFLGSLGYWLARYIMSGPAFDNLGLLTGGLVVALWAYLTRGFHLDGLADMFDGFGGGYTKQRALDIMKDSRSGAFGVISLVCLIGLKSAAIAVLCSAGQLVWIAIAPIVGRLMIAYQAAFSKYARQDGTGAGVVNQTSLRHFIVALLLALGSCLCYYQMLDCYRMLGVVAAAWLTASLVGLASRRKIGGVTGDILGATCELCEAAVLVSAVLLPW